MVGSSLSIACPLGRDRMWVGLRSLGDISAVLPFVVARCGVGALAPLEYAYYVLLSILSHLVRGLAIIVVLDILDNL